MKRKTYKYLIKVHEKIFWIVLVLTVVLMIVLRKDIVYSSYSQIIVVRGFNHQNSKVYANLFIKLPKTENCTINAKYTNISINRTFELNKTNLIMYCLPDMPLGNTKVFFKMKCERKKS